MRTASARYNFVFLFPIALYKYKYNPLKVYCGSINFEAILRYEFRCYANKKHLVSSAPSRSTSPWFWLTFHCSLLRPFSWPFRYICKQKAVIKQCRNPTQGIWHEIFKFSSKFNILNNSILLLTILWTSCLRLAGLEAESWRFLYFIFLVFGGLLFTHAVARNIVAIVKVGAPCVERVWFGIISL